MFTAHPTSAAILRRLKPCFRSTSISTNTSSLIIAAYKKAAIVSTRCINLHPLLTQLDYIALDKPTAAIDMDERIESQTSLLLDHPNLGRKGRVKGTRELIIAGTPFIAVYRLLGGRIEIFRFLHGAQQWPTKKP